jgi:hypothetical protein
MRKKRKGETLHHYFTSAMSERLAIELDSEILKSLGGHMDVNFKFELGSILKDSVTGFQGVVTGRTEWLYGCKRYVLTPQKLKDGRPIEGVWVDEPQLIEVKSSKTKNPEKPTHGPRNDPKR